MNTQASADEITIWRATRNVFIYARECDSKQIWKYAFQCFLLLFGAQTLDLIRTTCEQNYRWIVWWGDVNNVWNMRFFFFFFLMSFLVKHGAFSFRASQFDLAQALFDTCRRFSFRHTKSQAPLMWLITKNGGNYASHHHTPVFRASVPGGYSWDSGRSCSWFGVDFVLQLIVIYVERHLGHR